MEFNLLYLRATLPSLLKIQSPAVDLPLQSTVRAPPRGQKDNRAELANDIFPKKHTLITCLITSNHFPRSLFY